MSCSENPLFWVVAWVAMFWGSLSSASDILHTDHGRFRDPEGRIVFLRGVNVSGEAKLAPFVPMSPALLDPLPGWGFNMVRLLFVWEAYEPQRGQYNEVYLKQLTELADQAWKRGLYVVVDMHQDAYSRYIADGCGEGFPAWAVPSKYRHSQPEIAKNCSTKWAVSRAFSTDMHHSYRGFYAGDEGIRAAFVELWARLARNFASHPGVIGYDLLNEPWGGEGTELGPLYRDLAQVIRAEDPTSILFIEPTVFMTTFGLMRSALPKPEFGNFAYAPHFYDPFAAGMNSWSLWRSGVTRHAFKLMLGKARSFDAPLFVGEFGASGSMGNSRWFSDYQYDQLDSGFVSGAQWNYTPSWTRERLDGWNHEDLSLVGENGALRANFYPRPYVSRMSGTPVLQRELRGGDGSLSSYELEWNESQSGGETQVFVPGEILGHPEKFEAAGSGAGLNCLAEPDARRIRCRTAESGPMQLRISRRKL